MNVSSDPFIDFFLFAFWTTIAIAAAYSCYHLARNKNREEVWWLIGGLLIGPAALFLLYVLPSKLQMQLGDEWDRKKLCPYCLSSIQSNNLLLRKQSFYVIIRTAIFQFDSCRSTDGDSELNIKKILKCDKLGSQTNDPLARLHLDGTPAVSPCIG